MDETTETTTPESPEGSSANGSLEAVVDRLAERFPTLERPHIEEIVEAEAAQLEDGARVKDFIPVLVEHEVKDQLRNEADPLLPGAPGDD